MKRILLLSLAITLAIALVLPGSAVTQDPAGPTIIPELVGQIGGSSYAVAVQGNYAYLGVGPRLVVLDVSDASAPTVVGQTDPLSSVVETITVTGGYAYVAYGWELGIVDVSNPASPVLASTTDMSAQVADIAVEDDYAYVAAGGRLVVMHVAEPRDPSFVGDILWYGAQYPRAIAASGGYVYIAAGEAGMRVVSVADPSQPVEVGLVSTAAAAIGVAIGGHHAYVVDSENLHIIDVSAPTSPVIVSSVAGSEVSSAGLRPFVALEGAYAYVSAPDTPLGIIEVSDPTSPAVTATYQSTWVTCYVTDIAVTGGVAYLAAIPNIVGNGGLHVLDVSNPPEVTPVSATSWMESVHSLAVQDKYAYVTSPKSGLHAIRIADATDLVEVGSVLGQWHYSVATQGDYAYIGGGYGVSIYTIADPTQISHVGGVMTSPFGSIDVTASGDYAYIADGDGLQVIAIRDATNPSVVGVVETSDYAGAVAVNGDYAYVTNGRDGLVIVDASDPTNPLAVGSVGGFGYACAVAVDGGLAVIAAGTSGLAVIDVSEPTHPSVVGTLHGIGYASSIALVGGYAFVGQELGDGYLRIVDLADAAHPRLAGEVRTPSLVEDLAVVGNYAYVACTDAGLVAFRLLRDRVSTTIPIEGGSLSSSSGDMTFAFPTNSFTDTVSVTYRHLLQDQDTGPLLVGIGRTFELTAAYRDTDRPAQPVPGQSYTLTVSYAGVSISPQVEETLALYYWDGAQWLPEPTSALNMASRVISATPDHLSLWAVLGQPWPVYLPVVLRPL